MDAFKASWDRQGGVLGVFWGRPGGVPGGLGGFLVRPGEILGVQTVSQRRFGGSKRRLKCQKPFGQPKNAKTYEQLM